MDPQAVAEEIKPETPVEAALAVAAEKIVDAIARSEMKTAHSIASVLRAYEFMRKHRSHDTATETQVVLAIASECRGLVTWMNEQEIVGMTIFWPTSNPNVHRRRQAPEFDRDGQYVYFDWTWGCGEWKSIRRAIEYAAGIYEGARFVCSHDYRDRKKGNRKRGNGRLFVRKIHRHALDDARQMRRTNGHAGGRSLG